VGSCWLERVCRLDENKKSKISHTENKIQNMSTSFRGKLDAMMN
jgi:hypothetical protein